MTIPAGYAGVVITINPLDPTDNLGGSTSKVVDLQILGGGCCSLGGPGYGLDSPSSASLTIDDPDGGTPVVSLATGQTTAIEDVQTATFTVSRYGDDGTLTPVKFLLTGASATSDYQFTNDGGAGFSFNTASNEGTISFGTGQTAIIFTVTTTGEVGNKGLNLAMEAPPTVTPPGCCCGSVPAYALGSPGSATLTLADAPLAATGVDFDATAGQAFTGEVATFTDGDLSGALGDYSAQITWDDGHTSSGTIAADPTVRGQFDVTGTNTYSARGDYAGNVRILDAGVAFIAPFIGLVGPPPTPLPNITMGQITYIHNVPDDISFTYSITNVSSVTAVVPSFRASLYYSADGNFDSSDVLIATQIVTTGNSNPQTGYFQFASPLKGDPSRPYLIVVADPQNVIAETNKTDNVSNKLLLPTVMLVGPTPSIMTILTSTPMNVSVTPSGLAVATSIEGEIIGKSWVTMVTAPNNYSYTPRISGYLGFRAVAMLGSIRFESSVNSLEVQFPSFADITANPTVKAAANAAWQSTQNYAFTHAGSADPVTGNYTNMTVREEGFWVQLNTATGGGYVIGPEVYGDATKVGIGIPVATTPLGPARPADSPATANSPLDTATYTVAALHTHPPFTYADNVPIVLQRAAGPSGKDGIFYTAQDVIGLVYDYDASPVLARSQLNALAHIYPSGPNRRSTARN